MKVLDAAVTPSGVQAPSPSAPGAAGWTLLASTTSRVYRTPAGIVRIHNDSVPACEVLATARRARALRRAGVAVCLPVGGPGGAVTWSKAGLRGHWVDLGVGTETLDLYGAGMTTRALHDAGPDALAGERLARLDDPATHRLTLKRLVDGRIATAAEAGTVTAWLDRIEDGLVRVAPRLRPGFGSTALVHDDLWPKNFVTHDQTGETYLVDLDWLGLAHRDYDLASIVRAQAAGVLNQGQVAAFRAGYGASLPDAEVADLMGQMHRCRWLLGLMRRRSTCAWSHSVSRRLLAEAGH